MILGGIFLAAIVVIVLAASFGGLRLPNPNGQTVSVTGTYTAKAEPTEATIVIGFENEADTAAVAQQENADEMAGILTSLRNAGLTDDNFETKHESIEVVVYEEQTETLFPFLTISIVTVMSLAIIFRKPWLKYVGGL